MRTPLPLLVVLSACASNTTPVRGAEARPPGCPIDVLQDPLANGGARSLGTVTAHCTGDARDDVAWCTRALQDQACALGATVLWGVSTSRGDEATVMRGFAGRRP